MIAGRDQLPSLTSGVVPIELFFELFRFTLSLNQAFFRVLFARAIAGGKEQEGLDHFSKVYSSIEFF